MESIFFGLSYFIAENFVQNVLDYRNIWVQLCTNRNSSVQIRI